MKSFTDEAIVLRSKDLGEADRILTILTRGHGKIRVMAKGIRRPTSRKGGNLDLLTLSRVSIRKNRDWYLVTEAISLNSFLNLKKGVNIISRAYYLCELIDSLCPLEQSDEFVFDLLVTVLTSFQKNSTRKIWDFEYDLLRHLGYITAENRQNGLRAFIEGIIERELKTPKFYYSFLSLSA